MPSGFLLLLIILAVVATSFYYLVEAEGGFDELPRLLERVGIEVGQRPALTKPPQARSAVPAEWQSGSSRFSQGACQNNSDCIATGCSGEVCSGGGEVISTCEFSASWPSAQGYACGCVVGVCGWQ